MPDDLQITVVNDPQIIAVPQPDIQVLTETSTQPVVVESTAVEVVTLDDEVHVVDEVRDIQIVTVGEVGPRGQDGTPGSGRGYELSFAYGDATPAAITTAVAGKVVFSVELVITTPFDGVGATIVVGDAGQADRLMAATENDLSRAGSNMTAPAHVYGSSTPITLTIAPGAGASAGAGVLIAKIQS